MSDRAIDVYVNDHLGGATLGSNLAEQIRDRAEGPLEAVMSRLAERDRGGPRDADEIADELDISRNPVKQATGWIAEKASEVKFSGAGSGEPDQGLFMALESLRLGVAGKKCLWISLRDAKPAYPELSRFDLDALIERAVRAGGDARAGAPGRGQGRARRRDARARSPTRSSPAGRRSAARRCGPAARPRRTARRRKRGRPIWVSL